jgi:uncharacterized membrane protein YgcG
MKRLLPFALVLGTLVAPAGAFASGVVLKVQPARHLVAVARTPSSVALIHTAAASRLHVGQRVDMNARTLRNGTLVASAVTVVGHTRKVRFHGIVLGRSHGKLAVSAGGAVITVRTSTRSTASARDSSPATGSQVGVTATVGAGGELDESSVTVFSPTSPGGRIEGTLTLGTGTIAVTSEHMSLVITLPSGFDLSPFTNGQDVLATFSQQSNGSLLLTALSGDDNAQQADNQNQNQNKQSSDGQDHHGDGGGDDNGGDNGGSNGGNGGSGGGGGDD